MSSVLLQVNRKLDKELRSLGGVNSTEMKEARKALARAWRRVLSVRGGGAAVHFAARSGDKGRVQAKGGTPSAPGEPPRRQLGTLVKSVRAGVAGDQGRVVVQWFTAPLLEEGVNSALPLRSGKRRRRSDGKANRNLVIAARPSAQRAIAAAQDQLADIVAKAAEVRLYEASR